VCLVANNTIFVCMFYLVQMTVRPCSILRRVSAVHLAGSSILRWVQEALIGSSRRPHSSNVLMHVWLTPAVWLLIGMISRMILGIVAGYTTRIVYRVRVVIMSHTLKSSDNATQHQVRHVITCFCSCGMFPFVTVVH